MVILWQICYLLKICTNFVSGRFPSWHFITARIRMLEAYVFSLSTTGGGGGGGGVGGWRYPSLRFFPRFLVPDPLWGVPQSWPGGYPTTGVPLARTGLGYPSLSQDRTGVLPPTLPQRQNSRVSTCYAPGAMPRAVSRRRTFLFVVYFFLRLTPPLMGLAIETVTWFPAEIGTCPLDWSKNQDRIYYKHIGLYSIYLILPFKAKRKRRHMKDWNSTTKRRPSVAV